MTATNHALTGVVIAIVVHQPVAAPILALSSHFVLDAIPHWDYRLKFPLKKWVMISDVVLAVILSVAVASLATTFQVPAWLIFSCGILAIMPDAMWLPHILIGQPIPVGHDKPLYIARRFHRWVQWSETRPGAYLEVVWFVLFLGYILADYHFITAAPR